MQILTIITVIFVPLTFVATTIQLILFRRKGWL